MGNQGTVKWFNEAKGYGFISDTEGVDYFFHASAIQRDGAKTLQAGERVSFEVVRGGKGRPHAANVQPL